MEGRLCELAAVCPGLILEAAGTVYGACGPSEWSVLARVMMLAWRGRFGRAASFQERGRGSAITRGTLFFWDLQEPQIWDAPVYIGVLENLPSGERQENVRSVKGGNMRWLTMVAV